ncbi:retrovirus-related pol polyprotein from transposon TNT 1-94 [Tanacetum coccineum]
MLGPGRYSQWHSRFLRYLDTKSNGEYLRKCIFDGPYMPTNVLIAAVEAAENILPVAAHEEVETIHNMTAENKLYFQAEKEAIFLILTGIGDEIYSTVDACNTAKEMWTAIERLQQGESLNVQDVKTNLFWEFGKIAKPLRTLAAGCQPYSDKTTINAPNPQRSTCNNHTKAILLPHYQVRQPNTKSKRSAKPNQYSPQSDSFVEEDMIQNKRGGIQAKQRTWQSLAKECGIQCFNCKGFGHYARECRKPKRVKDYAYHKEKMMMCKQAEQGVPLQAEQADWLEDTDEEIDEQELEAIVGSRFNTSYNTIQSLETSKEKRDKGLERERRERVEREEEKRYIEK